jgi:L-histidine N-alpha-methyltransferase
MSCPDLEVCVTADDRRAALVRDVRSGLTGEPKTLPPMWFYDEPGSRLFEAITRLPEYYLTRTEDSILRSCAAEIVAVAGADALVEIGSGTSEKTRLLLDAMTATGGLRRIVLFDISVEVLEEAARALCTDYGVDVHAVAGDFAKHLPRVPAGGRRLWAFLGSTIGNLTGEPRSRLLAQLRSSMDAGDRLLLGTDLVKPVGRLVAAYDDAGGVTAKFNRNVLGVLNRELDASFDPALFDHVARWDPEHERVEMRLRSRVEQYVEIRELGLRLHFAAGEDVLTEVCDKFRPAALAAELETAGLAVEATYRDPQADFQLTLARPSG